MFIKDIVIGVIGLFVFPALGIFVNANLETQKGLVMLSGIFVSLSMIAYYFVNVYVIGKRKSFFTLLSSWLIILSVILPFAYLRYFSELNIADVILYIALGSMSISWLMVFIELFNSGTFKAY